MGSAISFQLYRTPVVQSQSAVTSKAESCRRLLLISQLLHILC